MVADLSFGSNVAMDLVFELDYSEVVQVASLHRQLFAVLDGKWICPVATRAPDMFGHLPDRFRIRDPGRPVVGSVAFELPADAELGSLELRLYHDEYAPLVLPLRAADEPVPSDEGPTAAEEENADVALRVDGFATPEIHAGRRAGAGRKIVTVDLVGHSRMATMTDALALGLDGAPDRRVPQPKVMEYQYYRDMLHLLGEGYVAFTPDLSIVELPDPLFFLPDLDAGYRLAFTVPESRLAALELRCFFPEMKLSDQKAFRQPRPLTFLLADALTASEPRSALAVIRDVPVQIGVMGFTSTDALGGRGARTGYRIAALELKLVNAGPESGMLTIHDRFKLAWNDRRPAAFDKLLSAASDRPPLEPMYMHVGEERTFLLGWNVPEDVDECVLDYQGVGLSASVPLSLGRIARGEQVANEPFDPPRAAVPPIVRELEPVGIEGFGISGAAVNQAIDRGRDFLWEFLRTEDQIGTRRVLGWRKGHGLAALALVHTGAHRKYPELDAALRRMLATAEPYGTYELGFYCMLVDAYGDPAFFDRLGIYAQTLVDRQGPRGTWGYKAQPEYPPSASEDEQEADGGGGLVVEGGATATSELPDDTATKRPLTRLTDWESGDDGDFSTTQFAILGLRAAARRGFEIPRRTWQRAHDGFVAGERGGTGGWGYTASSHPYGSMTCAGLSSLAIARHALEEEQPLAHPALFRGERWMDTNFSAASNPKHSDYYFYYIYSVERVGQLLDTDFIGHHEWYPLGVRVLLGKQNEDGSWKGGRYEEDPRIATAFALLFLTRATEKLEPESVEPPTGPGTLVTTYVPPPPRDLYVVLDASGSMMAEIDGARKFDIARDAIARLIETIPETTNVALRVYGHRKAAIHDGADEDTALELPLRALDRAAFRERLESLRPRGKTPLTLSLEEAAKDLRSVRTPVTVLLLTDGGEDTRARRDPVAAAAALVKNKHVDLRIVGFDINRDSWTRQLEEMAAAGGGQYWQIAQGSELAVQVGAVVTGAAPAFTIASPDGTTVAAGIVGERVELPPGRYVLRITLGPRTLEQEIGIRPDGTTRVTLDPAKFGPPR